MTLRLLKQCTELYSAVPSFSEMFAPVLPLVAQLESVLLDSKNKKKVSGSVVTLCTKLNELLKSKHELQMSTRRPLVVKQAIKQIKTYEPQFMEGYNPHRGTDPIKERAEQKKMQQKVKRERKGALRELRRDTAFIAQEKRRVEQLADGDRNKKARAVVNALQADRGDSNQTARIGKAQKLKEKRRGGAKHDE